MVGHLLRRQGVVCLFIFLICHCEISAVSKLDQQRLTHGLQAANNVARALKVMEFTSWVTKITSVAAGFLSVALVVVDIIFGFLGIESPEMIQMKSEFKNLNNRLDSFSLQFLQVKKKIDWSDIQVSFWTIESTVSVLEREREKMANVRTENARQSVLKSFIRKYENDFNLASEKLANAMSTDSILSDNLFEAARKYTHQHPVHTFNFMKGCTQLLLQAFAIQASYIHLKYNSTDADEYFKKISTEIMNGVAEKAKHVYNALQRDWKNQLKKDVSRLLKENNKLGNKKMVQYLYKYFTAKYKTRYWLINVYKPVSGWELHASYVCEGGNFFRIGGYNVNIATVLKSKYTGFTKNWAVGILNSFGEFRQDHSGAKAVLDRVMKHTGRHCVHASAAIVMGPGTDAWYIAPAARRVYTKKPVKWCNTNLCWIQRIRYYFTIIFG